MKFKEYIQNIDNIAEASDDKGAVTTFKNIVSVVKTMEDDFKKSGSNTKIRYNGVEKLQELVNKLVQLKKDLD